MRNRLYIAGLMVFLDVTRSDLVLIRGDIAVSHLIDTACGKEESI